MQPSNTDSIIRQFLQLSPVNNNHQIVSLIQSNPNFKCLCQHLGWALPSTNIFVPSMDIDYVTMKSCEKVDNVNNNSLELAVERLQQVNLNLQCLIQQLKDKNKWINSKCEEYTKCRNQTLQNCEILAHQNAKISQTIQKSQEQQDEEEEQGNNSRNVEKQMKAILQKYRCRQNGFPKNKNEAIKILNSLDLQIQKLQIQKLEHQ